MEETGLDGAFAAGLLGEVCSSGSRSSKVFWMCATSLPTDVKPTLSKRWATGKISLRLGAPLARLKSPLELAQAELDLEAHLPDEAATDPVL